MWCFSPSRTALDCYARHLTVTGCFKSDRNDYPVAFPDDLLLCSSSIPAGNQLPCPVPTTPSDQPQFLLAALLVLAFNHLTLFLWNLGFGQMLHMMKVDEGSNDDETFVESFLNFCGGYSLMFPSRIVEKKLYLPLHGSHPKCRVGIVAQKILKWYGSCTNQKQQLCTRAKLAKNCVNKTIPYSGPVWRLLSLNREAKNSLAGWWWQTLHEPPLCAATYLPPTIGGNCWMWRCT